jgi:thiol-disulfide isomerase/thioredoxin
MLHQTQLGNRALTLAVFAVCASFGAYPARADGLPLVTAADAAVLRRAIAAQKGKVVFVNFWATWCGPCVAEFPSIVRLDRSYRSRGLAVMTVSADLPDQLETGVKPFLAKNRVTFPQYIIKGGDPEVMINAFDPKWQGDLPRTFVYDRSGHLVKTFEGGQSYAQFESAVKPLLIGKVTRAASR